VAEEMGVGRTQIMNILKRKSETLDDFKNNWHLHHHFHMTVYEKRCYVSLKRL
jgi:predicted DNA-binding protein YlxM (UPF0122 family)